MGAVIDALRDRVSGSVGIERLRRALPLIDLAFALGVAALWYLPEDGPGDGSLSTGPWALVLLAGLWLVHWSRTSREFRRSALAVSMGLFLTTAAIGVWTAYDPATAGLKFWRLLGATGLCWAIAHQPDMPRLHVVLAVLGTLAGGLAAVYLFGSRGGIAAVPLAIATSSVPQAAGAWRGLPSLDMNANAAAGASAVLLPLYVPLLTLSGRTHRWRKWLWGVLAGVSLLALVVSASRGGLGALAAVGCLWGAWKWLRNRAERRGDFSDGTWRRHLRRVGIAGALSLAGAVVVVMAALVADLPGAAGLRNRFALVTSSAPLVRDYLFTGAGLGTYEMQYSVYALLIHVGYVPHSHNMLVDIAIEQGIGGLLSALVLGGVAVRTAVRRLKTATPGQALVLEAAVASLIVAFLHGLVDDVLYESRAMAFIGVPLGLIVAAGERGTAPALSLHNLWARRLGPGRAGRWLFPLGVALFASAIALWGGPLRGIWYADLGAIEQARVELATYDQTRFEERSLETVRREEDLSRSIALFERAVAADPRQATARQRLAEIDLARGAYAEALAGMEAAWHAGHRDTVTRLLYGDALVAAGQVAYAADIARGQPWAVFRLLGQMWTRYYARGDWRRAIDAGRAVLILEPGHEDAMLGVTLAEQRAVNR